MFRVQRYPNFIRLLLTSLLLSIMPAASAINIGSGNCVQSYEKTGTGEVSVTESGNYCLVAFKNTGALNSQTTFTWTRPAGAKSFDVLVVGGGGGGGSRHGGGGGAGGYVEKENLYAFPETTFTVIVGAGGTGAAGGTAYTGTTGKDSSFKIANGRGLTAIGGGGGTYSITGLTGGSGGGAGFGQTPGSGTTNTSQTDLDGNSLSGITFGNAGNSGAREDDSGLDYWAGGGGGGAGLAGSKPTKNGSVVSNGELGTGGAANTIAGKGGDGKFPTWITSSQATSLGVGHIDSNNVYFAGGGGGGIGADGQAGGPGGLGGGGAGTLIAEVNNNGAAFTGGGGGGSGFDDIAPNPTQNPGAGDGGSGVVVIRYSWNTTATALKVNFNATDTNSYDAGSETATTILNLAGGSISATRTAGSGGALISSDATTNAWSFPGGTNTSGPYIDVSDIDIAGFLNNGITFDFEADFGSVNDWERIIDFGEQRTSTLGELNNIFISRRFNADQMMVEFWENSTSKGSCLTSNSVGLSGLNRWTITFDGKTCRIWKAGTALSITTSSTSTAPPYTLPVAANLTGGSVITKNYIGRSNWTADAQFEGKIRYLRIYEGAFTPTEIGAVSYKTVTYSAGAGASVSPASVVTSGAVRLPTPTKAGTNFKGWSNGSTTFAENTKYTPTADITLNAQWSTNYTITYDANGGTGTTSASTFTPDIEASEAIAANGFTGPAGKLEFVGWNTSSNGTGTWYMPGAAYATNSNATLYAIWNCGVKTVSGNTVTYTIKSSSDAQYSCDWFTPSGVNGVEVLAVGGGGGGGFGGLGGGGGAGEVLVTNSHIASTSLSKTAIVIGAGGTTGAPANATATDTKWNSSTNPGRRGGTGGNTSFGSVIAYGGGGGGGDTGYVGNSNQFGSGGGGANGQEGGTVSNSARGLSGWTSYSNNGGRISSGIGSGGGGAGGAGLNTGRGGQGTTVFGVEVAGGGGGWGNGLGAKGSASDTILGGNARTNSGTWPYQSTVVSGVTVYTSPGVNGTGTGGGSGAPGGSGLVVVRYSLLPLFSLSSSNITALQNSAVTSYSVTQLGTSATSYAISPTLPTGLSLNSSTGVISGTPTGTLSQSSFTLTATNANGTSTANFNLTVSSNVLGTPSAPTLSATANTMKSINVSWSSITNASSYTLKIYAANGTDLLASVTGLSGTSKTVTASDFSSISDSTTYKISLTAIGTGSYVSGSESAQSSVTTTSPLVVTFEYNGATGGNANATASYSYGGAQITLPTPTKTGYQFGGWFSDSNLTTSIGAGGASYTPSSSTTIYAKWIGGTYTITINQNYETSTSTINYYSAGTVQLPTPTRTGYTFNGWNTAANGSGVNAGTGGAIYSPLSKNYLVLRYELDVASSYAGSGTTVSDLASQVNSSVTGQLNATSFGSPTYSTNDGVYMNFVGTSSQYLRTPDLKGRFSDDSVSMFVWFYPTSANGVVVAEIGQETINTLWHDSQIEMYNGKLHFNLWPRTTTISTASNVALNQWHYAGLTYDGNTNTLKAFLNGVLVGTVTNYDRISPWESSSSNKLVYALAATDSTSLGSGAYGTFRLGAFHVYSAGISDSTVLLNYQSSCARFVSCTQQTLFAQWSLNTYTVTFNANGGSGSMSNQSISHGTPTQLTANSFTRTGFAFNGWSTQDNGGGTQFTNQQQVTLTGNLILYAKWNEQSYVVTFDSQEGSPVPNGSFLQGGSVSAPANPVRPGYNFTGWFTASTGGSQVSFPYSPGVNQNITLYARWSVISYSLNFDSRGGSSVLGESFTVGATIPSAPSAPVRAGYTFNGWFKFISGGSVVTFPFAPGVTADVTLFAQWSAINYNITYNTNNASSGSAPTDAANYNIGQNIVVKANTGNLIRTGYTFAGWNTLANGLGDNYLSGAQYVVGSQNVTLFAKWSANTYTITYNSNGASGSPQRNSSNITSDSYTSGGTAITLPGVGSMQKLGHDFSGWSITPSGSSISGSYTTSTNITLYALWSIKSLSISYETGTAGGASLASHAFNVFPINTNSNYNARFNLPNIDLTIVVSSVTYAFAGWSDSTSRYQVGSEFITPANNVIFTANWVPIYGVRYLFNGGSAVGSESELDSECTQAGNACLNNQDINANTTPTRAGYEFNGWKNQVGQTVSAGALTRITSDNYIFSAQWTPIDYVISYSANQGSAVPSNFTKRIGQSFVTADATTRPGYSFAGWSDGNRTFGPGASYIVDSATVTLVAQWNPNVYRISYDWNGGRGTPVNDVDYTVGDNPLNLPAVGDVVKDGFIFDGWATTSGGSSLGASWTPDQTRTLFALWSTGNFVITLNASGGANAGGANSISVSNGSSTVLPLPTRANFVFEGWYTDAVAGTLVGLSGAQFVPTQSKTIYARWTQASLYGIPANSLLRIGTTTASNTLSTTFTAANATSSITVYVPAGSLPAGTVINYDLVGDFSRARNLISQQNNYIVSFAISWLASDGSVPDTTNGNPILVTIRNATIKAGATAFAIVGGVSQPVGTATQDGSVTFEITSDPEVLVAITKPDKPTGVTATGNGIRQSVISWSAPVIDGGSPITSYTATANTGQFCVTSNLSCTISGLANGSTYTYTVTATNSIGTSVASDSATATTAAANNVTFDSKGGSSVTGTSFVLGESISAPSTPTRSGFSFNGWSITDGGSAVVFPYTPVVAQALIFYALWSQTQTPGNGGGSGGGGSVSTEPSCNAACIAAQLAAQQAAAEKAAAEKAAADKAAAEKAAAEKAAAEKAAAELANAEKAAKELNDKTSSQAAAAAQAAKEFVEKVAALTEAKLNAEKAATEAESKAKLAEAAKLAAEKAVAAAKAAAKSTSTSQAQKAAASKAAAKAASKAQTAVKEAAAAARKSVAAELAEAKQTQSLNVVINGLVSATARAKEARQAALIAEAAKKAAQDAAKSSADAAIKLKNELSELKKLIDQSAETIVVKQKESAAAALEAKNLLSLAAKASSKLVDEVAGAKKTTDELALLLKEKAELTKQLISTTTDSQKSSLNAQIDKLNVRIDELVRLQDVQSKSVEIAIKAESDAKKLAEDAKSNSDKAAAEISLANNQFIANTKKLPALEAEYLIATKIAAAAKSAAAKIPTAAVVANTGSSKNKNSATATITGLKPGQTVKVTVNIGGKKP